MYLLFSIFLEAKWDQVWSKDKIGRVMWGEWCELGIKIRGVVRDWQNWGEGECDIVAATGFKNF